MMVSQLLLLVVLVHTSLTTPLTSNRTSGDYRTCLGDTYSNVNLFEVLPGGGWDNLMNKNRGIVLDVTYSGCKTTEDRKYLLPDFVNTVPNKVSEIDTSAKLFTHWSQYKSVTSSSVNTDVGATFDEASVSGSFGNDHQSVKETQIEYKSYTTQVQLRYNQYKAELQPGFSLNPSFKSRLLSIASNLDLKRHEEAEFESQLLVREYGTHVITEVDAGAVLVKEVSIQSSFLKDSDLTASQVTATASATFFGLDKFDSSYSHKVSDTQVQSFTSHTTKSKVYSHGGPSFKLSNFTPNDWLAGIDNNLVAIDRVGDPIYFFISASSLPELSVSTVYQLRKSVEDAVALYYKFNAYRGCTDPDSPNFSLTANLDDGSCKESSMNVSFGGVYQTCNVTDLNSGNICTDDKLDQVNPLTGTYSCPPNFEPVPVTSGTVNKQWIEHSCQRCWVFLHCCHDIAHTSTATYEGFWCSAVTTGEGFFFGGVFTSQISNPLTQAKICPDYYIPLHLGTDLSVCVSDDGDFGPPNALALGGFFTCRVGNPLAVKASKQSKPVASGQWPKQCPTGYSIHVATTDQGCPINYCVVSNSFRNVETKTVRRPPYIKTPVLSQPAHSFSVYDSVSNKWMKNDEAFAFIRSNIVKASNVTTSEILMSRVFPKVNPASQTWFGVNNGLTNLQQGSLDASNINDETVESPARSSLHSSYQKWQRFGEADSVMQKDVLDEARPKADGNAGSNGVLVGSIIVGLLFVVIVVVSVIRYKMRGRVGFIPTPKRVEYERLETNETA